MAAASVSGLEGELAGASGRRRVGRGGRLRTARGLPRDAALHRPCVECREADDCPEQCDTLWGRCVECLDGHDSDSGFCDSAGGVCLP
jgi:hypothetical protein